MRETVNTRLPPSVTEVSAIEIPDWSLSRMVPAPVASVMVSASLLLTSCAAESTTVNASGGSTIALSTTGMVMVAVVAPAGMMTVALVAPVKSVPATALPLTVL